MDNQLFQRVGLICDKPRYTWSLNEEEQVYWWFYHEMELPDEEQLRMFARRYFLILKHRKWCMFLLQSFPSEENLCFVKLLCGERSLQYLKAMKGVLNTRPLSQAHIDIAFRSGLISVHRKARKIASRQYEI